MNLRAALQRPGRRVFLLLVVLLVLQYPSKASPASALQASSVSVSMSNPTCFQVLPANGACTIQINNLTASGSDSSFSRVELLVNGKLRAYMGGFFESTAYLSAAMLRGGLMVACGRSNAGGLPDYGMAYTVTVNAYMADNTTASASQNVYCPAFAGNTYVPVIRNK